MLSTATSRASRRCSWETPVRERFVGTIERRWAVLERWVEDGVCRGELVDIPPKALASLLLALADGLLHSGLQPTAFRWPRVRHAVDTLLQLSRSLISPSILCGVALLDAPKHRRLGSDDLLDLPEIMRANWSPPGRAPAPPPR